MIEKLLESENGGIIAAIVAILFVVGIGELGKTARAGMENGYEMTATVNDRGEVKIKPDGKADDDEEDTEESETLIQSE